MRKSLFAVILALSSAYAFASVTSYFNHNQQSSYTDPYRKISRSGDNLEQVLINEIQSAKKTIYIAVQELRLPLLAQALIDKKNAGVDVKIILENNYNHSLMDQSDTTTDNQHEATRLSDLRSFIDVNLDGLIEINELETRDAIYMLRKAKVSIIDDTSDLSLGAGLMHHKFVIVDGKSTLVSTANFTMSCIHGDYLTPKSLGNANSLVLVRSLALAKIFTDEFNQMWGNGQRGNFGLNKTYRGRQTVTVRGTKITVQFSPTSRKYSWQETVNGLIGDHLSLATKSVEAALFVFSDQNMANILEKSEEAGAQMGILVERKFAYRDYSELLDMMGLGMLNAKCQFEPYNRPWSRPAMDVGTAWLPKGDVLHHKFAVVDRKTVIMGSQNWSDAANFVNDETLMVIENRKISDSYTLEYERLKSKSTLGITTALQEEIIHRQTVCASLGSIE